MSETQKPKISKDAYKLIMRNAPAREFMQATIEAARARDADLAAKAQELLIIAAAFGLFCRNPQDEVPDQKVAQEAIDYLMEILAFMHERVTGNDDDGPVQLSGNGFTY